MVEDSALREELELMEKGVVAVNDAFYRHLEFGTGGLRGILGVGTNRMNIYTVRRASRGLAGYVTKNGGKRIAIGYDTRINSRLFAETAAKVFADFGLDVFMYSEPFPTPMLSYAVRELSCNAGIMITASHNPANYNGYKVYSSDGCQITDAMAKAILNEINSFDYFDDAAIEQPSNTKGKIQLISDSVFESYIDRVSETSHLFGDRANKKIKIVYTALNGTGYRPVLRVLEKNGFSDVLAVSEQAMPNGNFPTCPYPNPEIPEALALGLEYAKRVNAEILLATDPDCDRVGVAVRCGTEYKILTGNEVGLLLFGYICEQRKNHKTMPQNPIAIKTIVTTDMAEKTAAKYGVEMKNVLTGFKYIGELIGRLEEQGKENSCIFGFEESCGYLGGSYVRDKDGVYASLLVSEMAAYYSEKGINLYDKLNSIYSEFGYTKNSLYSYAFDGAAGYEKMQKLMCKFRSDINFGDFSVIKTEDYLHGINGLPKSNVIKLFFDNSSSIVVRPSGTEPKLKIYVSVTAKCEFEAKRITEKIKRLCESIME